jgi:L-rhamnose mutarotase
VQRVCFLLRVKPDRLDEYKAAHRNVWPEMREALSRHGWHNYSLFLGKDGLLVGYVELDRDFEQAVAGMQGEDVNARWQAAMTDFFEPLKTGAADTSLVTLEQVFYLP